MAIWQKEFTLEYLNDLCKDSMISNMEIEFIEKGDDYLKARMPVTHKISQPLGLLHGGASAALAESVASLAGSMCTLKGFVTLGLDLNCSHVKSAKIGDVVIAIAKPIHIGGKIQVWQIDIIREQDQCLICSAKISLYVAKKPQNKTSI